MEVPPPTPRRSSLRLRWELVARQGRVNPAESPRGAGRATRAQARQEKARAGGLSRAPPPVSRPRPAPRSARHGAGADASGRAAAGRASRRLRRAAASLARTDAIIAAPRQTPREFRSPHGNCSSRSRSRLLLPPSRGARRERDPPSALRPAPSSGRARRRRRQRQCQPRRLLRPPARPPAPLFSPLLPQRRSAFPATSTPGKPASR